MTLDLFVLAALGIKSIVIAGAALVLLRLIRQRSAGERSAVAHLALLAITLLPVGALLLPAWNPVPVETVAAPTLADLPAVAPTAPAVRAALVVPDERLVTTGQIAFAAYLLPLALLLATVLLAVARLFAMRRRAAVLVDAPWLGALALAQRRMGFKHGTALLVSDELRSPISWGVFRPTIVLDERVVGATGEAEAIIAHELAHVARLDWAKLLLARIACALFWFNPLVWMLARESHQLREEAADDAVLMTEVGGPAYATLLVNAARHDNAALLLAAHGVAPGRDSLKRRVTRVLGCGLRRDPATGAFLLGALAVAGGLAGPLAALDPFAAAPAQAAVLPAVLAPVTEPTPPRPATAARPAPIAPQAPLAPETLTRLRATGATPAEVRALRRPAGTELTVEQIVQARATGVDPAYAARIRAAFPDADMGAIVNARAVGVEATYASAMHAADPALTLADIVQARAVGVPPAYQAEMRRLFPGARLTDLTAMRAVGVTPEYVRALRRGGGYAEPRAVVRARAMGTNVVAATRQPGRVHAVVVQPDGTRIEATVDDDDVDVDVNR